MTDPDPEELRAYAARDRSLVAELAEGGLTPRYPDETDELLERAATLALVGDGGRPRGSRVDLVRELAAALAERPS